MIVEQIWTANRLRNFNYLIACDETGEALAIDPLDFRRCLAVARDRGFEIRQILNTHEHHDHIGGNEGLVEATGARVLAHAGAAGRIPSIDVGLGAGDSIRVGKTVELECLDTPGHTMSHICLLAHGKDAALFSGDTMFNAGAGNCHNGGHPEALYETFHTQLAKLPDDTRLFPGHDYLANNLGFTLDREPGNARARELLDACVDQNPDDALVTTLALERSINTFLRLDEPEVVGRLQAEYPELGDRPSPEKVFLKLRELRNRW